MNDLQLEAYKSLSQEIKSLLREARQLELYCGGAVAGLYSWYASVKLTNMVGWYLPLLIPVLGLIRAWAFHARARHIAGYLQKIESVGMKDASFEGWECYYAKIRPHGLTPSGLLFWVLLFTLCIVFPIVFNA